MPVEVRELIIKATINQEPASASAATAHQADGQGQEEIIKICVEKVLEIIKDKHGR